MALAVPEILQRPALFEKNARRWCATPQFLRELHRELNRKLDRIAAELEFYPALTPGDGSQPRTCLIASGVAFAHTYDLLDDLGLLGQIDFYQVTMPYPLNRDFIREVDRVYDKILVLEETYRSSSCSWPTGGSRAGAPGPCPTKGS